VTCRSRQRQKHKFGVTCPSTLFMDTAPGPPEHEKQCINVSCPRRTGMNYVTHKFHRMQKHKFGATCPDVLVMESLPGPPKQEKKCVDVSRPERTGIHYVTHRSLRMQKDKFSVTFANAFYGNRTGPTRVLKIVCRCFTPQTHRIALRDPQIPSDGKHKLGVTYPDALLVESVPVLHEHENLCVEVSRPDALV
jgi:hypothetical protein